MPSAPRPQQTATTPCPGCGRPVAATAAICTSCGQKVRSDEQLQTKLGRPEASGPPPIPAIAPGPGRFRGKQIDHEGRRLMVKAAIMAVVGVGLIMIWKAAAAEESRAAEALGYLARYAITVVGAWGICMIMSLMFLEPGVTMPQALLGLAGAIGAADFAQHACNGVVPVLPTLAWVLAIMVCVPTIADLLDMDYPDAAFLMLGTYLYKVILKFTLFQW